MKNAYLFFCIMTAISTMAYSDNATTEDKIKTSRFRVTWDCLAGSALQYIGSFSMVSHVVGFYWDIPEKNKFGYMLPYDISSILYPASPRAGIGFYHLVQLVLGFMIFKFGAHLEQGNLAS